ncbi:HTTM domain-containing protein [Natronobiforma cellulositropha]|uniref:HTTM domain-containing protein n=1 Tax=Natronobiforma cellulositropha TaxID=1679076 RepID=UPI0021D59062|nr:HTTM domain-containing protein [Natronobiforma cellulositropha]
MARTATGRVTGLSRRIFDNLRECVRIDARTLAVFRVFIGLLIIADVALRSRNFSFYYTNDGTVPRDLALAVREGFSFFHLTTDPTLIALLLGVQVLFAIGLIVGYKTRLMMIVSFLFVISLDHHNPLVTSYADTLFRLLTFWAIFLPLGERWSVDAVHRDRPPRQSVASVATALILLQMVHMYFLNGYHKSQNELWTGGTATPKIMGLDDMTFLLAEYVREFPTLLTLGGLLWFYMLLLSPLLILLVGRKRLPLLVLFVGGHATFALTVRIGAFAYVALAGLTLFVQTQLWEDGQAILRFLDIDIAPLVARLERLERLAAYLPAYRFDSPDVLEARQFVYNAAIVAIIGAFVVFALFSYAPVAGFDEREVGPERTIEDTAATFGVAQPPWGVFAPTPRTTDRYYVFPAETVDGERFDVYNDRELTFQRPAEPLQTQYGTYRERFYMNSVRRAAQHDRNDAHRHLAEHLCETWGEERGVELTHVNMYTVTEPITMDTIDPLSERDQRAAQLYRHGCGDNEPKTLGLPDI